MFNPDAQTVLSPEVFRFDPPALALSEIQTILLDGFGLDGNLVPLRGERDQNVLVTDAAGTRYVLKISSVSEDPSTVEFHAAALAHIGLADPDLPVPKLIPTVTGELIDHPESSIGVVLVRLLTFLPGRTYDDEIVDPSALRAIGYLQGRLTRALASFDHPASTNFMAWDIANGLINSDGLREAARPETRRLITPLDARLAEATHLMRTLPHQVIHNDGHRGNLLRGNESDDPVGIIDFGDLVHTARANELGISGASFIGAQPSPGDALSAMCDGFHDAFPLSPEERAAVPELVLARLALSTLLSEYQIRETPHIADAIATELPAILRDLERWTALTCGHVGR